jgi:hypothetical protein
MLFLKALFFFFLEALRSNLSPTQKKRKHLQSLF